MSLPAGCCRVTLRALRMIALGWLLVPGARLCFAQAGGSTATLRGNVADPSDAVVANASVTLTDIGTKTVRAAVTDDRGAFTFAGLFPGSYDLSVELDGFKRYEVHAVPVGPNDSVGIHIRLVLGR